MFIGKQSDVALTAIVEGNAICSEGAYYPIPVVLTYEELQDDRFDETINNLRKEIADRYPLSLYTLTALEDENRNNWLS